MKLIIDNLMEAKNITRYRLSKDLNIVYPLVMKMYKRETTSIQFDTLEKLCRYFSCTPNDILIFDDQKDT